MPTLLITYDIKERLNKPMIANAINELGSCVRLSESSYALFSHLSPHQIHNTLKVHINEDDNLFVFTLHGLWWANCSQHVMGWLRLHIKP